MKKDEVINGYLILKDFTTAGGGLSKWTFAAREDEEYFIKEFLAPIYPVDGSPGSTETKDENRRKCEQFETHHENLKQALEGMGGRGGNLVVTRDFFRKGTKYYKVTDKIDVASLSIDKISALPLEERLLLLITVAHSLRILHKADIVHGDLKPDNILIKQTATKKYTTKLIDFDNSYFSGRPPTDPDYLLGDQVYYAPEAALYVARSPLAEPTMLTTKSDIFSLGLVYCKYLTGELPEFDDKYSEASAAVNDGQTLVLRRGLPDELTTIVESMLDCDPRKRPDVERVFGDLRSLREKGITEKTLPPPKPPEGRSGLTGTLTRPKSPKERSVPKPTKRRSGLTGTLLKSKK